MINGEVYKIGRLGKAHGIKGEVSMFVDDDVFDRVDAEYLILELDGIMVPFFMEEYRFKTDETALIKLRRPKRKRVSVRSSLGTGLSASRSCRPIRRFRP